MIATCRKFNKKCISEVIGVETGGKLPSETELKDMGIYRVCQM